MPARRRGARTGRGWDAAPPRPRQDSPPAGSAATSDDEVTWAAADDPLWTPEEDTYTRAPAPARGREPGGGGGLGARVAGDRGSSDRGSEDRGSEDRGSEDRGSEDRSADDWAADDLVVEGRAVDDQGADERGARESRERGGRGRSRWGDGRAGGGRGGRGRDGGGRDGGGRDGGGQGSGGRDDAERRPEPPRDPAQVARDICLQQLAVRPRTRSELAAVLHKRGISDQVATEVLDRYDEVGLIDDAAFAKAWVTSRHHGKGLARRALAGELKKRGVDGELVGAALEEVDQETEAATARALVDRRLRSMPAVSPEAVFRRLVGMLARKGYPPGLAITVVKEAVAARRDEIGEFADVVDPDDLPDLVGETDDPIR
ncbi:hypothetical protein GCM10023322_16770 [Rugosimonospora acidiphila]|uniref:Regulatory protein RecX n=1 Tax=Rugosimonospora acidiphila TaxID=556531 RepID=A0ABP9RNI0_9ACTN